MIVFDLEAYLPDSLIPGYESVRDTLLSWLEILGIAKSAASDAGAGEPIHCPVFLASNLNSFALLDSSKAKQALSDAERKLGDVKSETGKSRVDLNRLFDPAWFGKEGEFKKLDGTCIEKDTGEYARPSVPCHSRCSRSPGWADTPTKSVCSAKRSRNRTPAARTSTWGA